MKFRFVWTLIGLSPILAHSSAGMDLQNLTPLGFSQNGDYFAFMTSGSSQGSGAPYASVVFIDVNQNKYSDDRITRSISGQDYQDESVHQYEGQALAASKPTLERRGISAKFAGRKVITKAVSTQDPKSTSITFLDSTSSSPRELKLTLTTLKGRSRKSSPMCAMGISIDPKRIKLTLADSKGVGAQTLQEDPPSRARECVNKLEIGDVFLFTSSGKSKIVAMLRVFSAGFEGEDIVSHMAVSGIFSSKK